MKFGRTLAIIVHYSTIQFGVLQKFCIEHGPNTFLKIKKLS